MEKLRRFAHAFARRNLKEYHYDNCKVAYSQAHAYGLTFEYLLRGYSTQQIGAAYYQAMLELHAMAVDAKMSIVVPSGVISAARERLDSCKPANPHYGKRNTEIIRHRKCRL